MELIHHHPEENLMQEHELPTWQDIKPWQDIKRNTATRLDAARSDLSHAGDWLRSDWQPLGASLPTWDGEARREAQRLIGEAKALIDQAKQALGY